MTVTETNPEPLAADATDESVALTGPADATADEVVDEVLVEEISIDGMCGVY